MNTHKRCPYILKNKCECKRFIYKTETYCWQHIDILFCKPVESIFSNYNKYFNLKFDYIGDGSYGETYKHLDLVKKRSNIKNTVNIREICFLSQFNHGLISQLGCIEKINPQYKSIKENDKFNLILKYGGITLEDYYNKNPNLDLVYIIYQLLHLLNQMDALDIIHGDIKGTNIVINESNQITLIDWGSYFINSKYINSSLATFEAPESGYFKNKFFGPINDIYRLGMTILFLYDTTQILDKDGYLIVKRLSKIYEKNIALDTSKIPNVEIRNLVDRMLKVNYLERPSAKELLDDSIFNKYLENKEYGYNLKKINSYNFKIKNVLEPIFDVRNMNIYGKSGDLCDENENLNVRNILINWIWEVCEHFNILKYYINTVYLLDTYSSYNFINTKEFQCIGASCLFNVINLYEIDDHSDYLVNMADGFTINDLYDGSIKILEFFEYKIFIPKINKVEINKNTKNLKEIKDLLLTERGFGVLNVLDEISRLIK